MKDCARGHDKGRVLDDSEPVGINAQAWTAAGWAKVVAVGT